MNCWDCKYIIQGQSVCCAHPEGKQKYIYWFAYNTCTIGKFDKYEGEHEKNLTKRMEITAKEVGWLKDGEPHDSGIQRYKPAIL
jgi:hypothetical protein